MIEGPSTGLLAGQLTHLYSARSKSRAPRGTQQASETVVRSRQMLQVMLDTFRQHCVVLTGDSAVTVERTLLRIAGLRVCKRGGTSMPWPKQTSRVAVAPSQPADASSSVARAGINERPRSNEAAGTLEGKGAVLDRARGARLRRRRDGGGRRRGPGPRAGRRRRGRGWRRRSRARPAPGRRRSGAGRPSR